MEYIAENEIVEDLQAGDLRIIQKTDGFKFGTDAVLLADFSKRIRSDSTLDLCTGSGIIPILLSHKTNCRRIVGIEITPEYADMAQRSVMMNGLSDRVEIICGDLRNSKFPKRSFELITCNPPYIEVGAAVFNEKDSKIVARHEVSCTLEDMAKFASEKLKMGGRITMVHRPTRLVDIMSVFRSYELEPKRMRFIHASKTSEPTLVLIEAMLRGGKELKILPPLFINEPEGIAELDEIYERKN